MKHRLKRAFTRLVEQDSRGFTLLESLIAIVVMSMGLMGIAGLQVSAIRNNASSQGYTLATNWASVEIDRLINGSYTDPLLTDTNGDGVSGLDATLNPDHTIVGLDQQGKYTMHWNVAVNHPHPGAKTVNVIILWEEREKRSGSRVE